MRGVVQVARAASRKRPSTAACCGACRGLSTTPPEGKYKPSQRRFPWEVLDPHADLSTTEFEGKPVPKSLVFKHITDETKSQIYRRYKKDPTPKTMTALAREYRIERPRAEMIVRLKELADYYAATGIDLKPEEPLDPEDPESILVTDFDEFVSVNKDQWIEDHSMRYTDLTTDYVDGADEAHKAESAPRLYATRQLDEDEIFAPPPKLSREQAEEFDASRKLRKVAEARAARKRSVPEILSRMRLDGSAAEAPAPTPAAAAATVAAGAAAAAVPATAAAGEGEVPAASASAPPLLGPFGRSAAPIRKGPWKFVMVDLSVKNAAALVRDEAGRLRIATEEEEMCLSWNKTG